MVTLSGRVRHRKTQAAALSDSVLPRRVVARDLGKREWALLLGASDQVLPTRAVAAVSDRPTDRIDPS